MVLVTAPKSICLGNVTTKLCNRICLSSISPRWEKKKKKVPELVNKFEFVHRSEGDDLN